MPRRGPRAPIPTAADPYPLSSSSARGSATVTAARMARVLGYRSRTRRAARRAAGELRARADRPPMPRPFPNSSVSSLAMSPLRSTVPRGRARVRPPEGGGPAPSRAGGGARAVANPFARICAPVDCQNERRGRGRGTRPRGRVLGAEIVPGRVVRAPAGLARRCRRGRIGRARAVRPAEPRQGAGCVLERARRRRRAAVVCAVAVRGRNRATRRRRVLHRGAGAKERSLAGSGWSWVSSRPLADILPSHESRAPCSPPSGAPPSCGGGGPSDPRLRESPVIAIARSDVRSVADARRYLAFFSSRPGDPPPHDGGGGSYDNDGSTFSRECSRRSLRDRSRKRLLRSINVDPD